MYHLGIHETFSTLYYITAGDIESLKAEPFLIITEGKQNLIYLLLTMS